VLSRKIYYLATGIFSLARHSFFRNLRTLKIFFYGAPELFGGLTLSSDKTYTLRMPIGDR
jgi:hypothetical protein